MGDQLQFGCGHCFGAAADAFYERLPKFATVARLIDEPHFIVRIAACPECRQRCVTVFTETVDLKDGEDPQYRWVVPLNPEESEQLKAQGAKVALHQIEKLGSSRRHLRTLWPKGEDQTILWTTGPMRVEPIG